MLDGHVRVEEPLLVKNPATSKTGWWIAGLLEKHSHAGQPPYWNNYRLIKASDWRTAFRKATEMGKANARVGNEAFSGHQEFIGVSDLLPVNDELEDGAELLWQELEASDEGDGIPLQVFTETELESRYEPSGGHAVSPDV